MSSGDAKRAWEGRVVAGKYPLRQWLGGSERSAVFLSDQPGQTSRKFAIKLVEADTADSERQLSRFRAAAQLSHPDLIHIFEAGRCQLNGAPLLYVVMEYADEDLSQILPQRPLTPAEAAELLPPLLDALSYLHEKGYVHGHIRPSNVLAVSDHVKLSADGVTSSTKTSSRRWRDVYDAPETATGLISPAGDVWSLGVTLVAALTQDVPSAGETQVPGRLEEMLEPFRGIARECLHLDPKRRCSIAQIRARLQPPGRSVPVAPPPIPSAPVHHYHYTWRMLIPIAVLLAFGFGVRVFRSIFRQKAPSGEQFNIQVAPEPAQARGSAATSPPHAGAPAQGQVVHQVLPDIPKSAMDTITGTIKISVRLEVDPSGKVTAAKLVSSGPSAYFASRVLKAAQAWEFAPPQVAGQPAASTWLLRFRLRRTSIQVSPERATH